MIAMEDSVILPADDLVVPTGYGKSGEDKGKELQQPSNTVGKRKRIYSFSLKVTYLN